VFNTIFDCVKEDYHPILIVWHFVGNPAHVSFRANLRAVVINVLDAEEINQYPQQEARANLAHLKKS
jgi:hypothetical protein